MEKRLYQTPQILVEKVMIEKGFATSLENENTYGSEGAPGMLQEGEVYNF